MPAPPPPAEPAYPPEYLARGSEGEVGWGLTVGPWEQAGAPTATPDAGLRCYWSQWKDDNGSLFYSRRVDQRVNWCAKDGRIMSWSVAQWPSTGAYCAPAWGPESWRLRGGVGSTFVEVMTRGGFACNLFKITDPMDWIEVDVRYTASGGRSDI